MKMKSDTVPGSPGTFSALFRLLPIFSLRTGDTVQAVTRAMALATQIARHSFQFRPNIGSSTALLPEKNIRLAGCLRCQCIAMPVFHSMEAIGLECWELGLLALCVHVCLCVCVVDRVSMDSQPRIGSC